jgi:hypothetical protein
LHTRKHSAVSTQQGGQRRTDAGEPVGGRCVAAAATDRFRPCWPRMKHTPWLQSAPLHPLAHAQLWLPPLAVHVAPFLQGLLSHPVAWLQSAPLHPLAHAQLWLPPLAVHVAPFLQGLLSHPVAWLQSAPLHPLAHAQLWLPPLAVHVAPFLQGLLSHPVAWLQSAPLHPLAHAQLWLPPLAVHVAPFLQGLLPAVKSHPVLSLQSTPFHPPAQKQAGTPSTSLQKPWEPHSTSPAAVHECGCFRSAITPTSAPSAPAASRMPMATSSCHLRQQP